MYRNDDEVFLATQNIAEFWNVCTRPAEVNGLGLNIEAADRYTAQMARFLAIVPESAQAFDLWRRLVVDHAVIGAKVHDARLAAIMRAYGISHIMTFNTGDFARFPGITVIQPADVRPADSTTGDERPGEGKPLS